MNKAEKTLERIFLALGLEDKADEKEETNEVKLAQMNTEEGVLVESESFVEGDALFVVTEEGNIPAPEGDHVLEDGTTVAVDSQGIIISVKKKEDEEKVEEESETEMSKDNKEQPAKSIIETTSRQTNFSEIETKLSETETKLSELETKLSDLESAKATLENEKKQLEEKNVQLSADVEALKKQLEDEPVEKTNHSPEKVANSKPNFHISPNRKENIADRVFDALV